MAQGTTERSTRTRQTMRIVVIVILVAVIVAFAVDNSQDVEVGWAFGNSDLALWIVIVASAVVGAVVGYAAGRRRA